MADLVGLGADAGLPAARPGRGVADLQVLLLDQLREDAGALAGRSPALLAAVRVGRLHRAQRGCVACRAAHLRAQGSQFTDTR